MDPDLFPYRSIDTHGNPWIHMEAHGYPWVSMGNHGYPWYPLLSMGIHGYPWIPMDTNGFRWIIMDSHRPPRTASRTHFGHTENRHVRHPCVSVPPRPRQESFQDRLWTHPKQARSPQDSFQDRLWTHPKQGCQTPMCKCGFQTLPPGGLPGPTLDPIKTEVSDTPE